MKVRLPKNSAPNMQNIMEKAQKAQEEMEKASLELESKEYTSTSGGGAVKVTLSGKLEIKELDINPEIVDTEDLEMLSDTIIAAVNDAIKQATNEKDNLMENISGKISLPGMF